MNIPSDQDRKAHPDVRKTAPLAPDYPDEASARAAGWQTVTATFVLPPERALAELVLAGFRGERPGHRPVPVRIVADRGDASRISFVRRADQLAEVRDSDDCTAGRLGAKHAGPHGRQFDPQNS